MARKKKTEVETKNTDSKEVNAKQGLGINYEGVITVSLKSGNRTINKKHYHNRGHIGLFKFICEALAGNFNKDIRPSRIRCYNADVPATPYITYETTALSRKGTDNSYSVTYTFKIPYAFVYDKISSVKLFPTNSDLESDVCADFTFEEIIDITQEKFTHGNYCIVLEWQMTISNKSLIEGENN